MLERRIVELSQHRLWLNNINDVGFAEYQVNRLEGYINSSMNAHFIKEFPLKESIFKKLAQVRKHYTQLVSKSAGYYNDWYLEYTEHKLVEYTDEEYKVLENTLYEIYRSVRFNSYELLNDLEIMVELYMKVLALLSMMIYTRDNEHIDLDTDLSLSESINKLMLYKEELEKSNEHFLTVMIKTLKKQHYTIKYPEEPRYLQDQKQLETIIDNNKTMLDYIKAAQIDAIRIRANRDISILAGYMVEEKESKYEKQ